MFEIELTAEAERQYRSLDDRMARRINRAIDALAENPLFGPNIIKLRGQYSGLYRYRVGSYRIIYSVDVKERIVTIRSIIRRSRAYRRL